MVSKFWHKLLNLESLDNLPGYLPREQILHGHQLRRQYIIFAINLCSWFEIIRTIITVLLQNQLHLFITVCTFCGKVTLFKDLIAKSYEVFLLICHRDLQSQNQLKPKVEQKLKFVSKYRHQNPKRNAAYNLNVTAATKATLFVSLSRL